MASQDTPKTIEIQGYGIQKEATAQGTITPGMLIERVTNGVQAHSTAAGPASTHFAIEYGMTGRTIDDDYSADDQAVFKTYTPGSVVYGLVAAGASAISQYDFLASAGDGTLATAGVDEVAVAQALEDVDNSGGSDPVRIMAEVVPVHRTNPA
jgi:hypothetical protein